MSPMWSVLGLRTATVGTGDPHYVQKSLVWTKLDTAMTGWRDKKQRGRQKSSWCHLQTSHVVNPGQHTQRLSLEIPPGCLDTCAPTDLRRGPAVGLWSLEITTLLTTQAQWHYVILFSFILFAHGQVCPWLWYVS